MKQQTAKLPTVKAQAGFTLIELIMVIVILGVLSAFALPRFADLGGEARTASINGLAGAIRSAANIAHAQQLADGTAAGTDVSLEGVTIAMVNGYPQALAATNVGIAAAAQISAGTAQNLADGEVDYEVVTTNAGAGGGAEVVYQLRANCSVTYTAAVAANPSANPAVAAAPIEIEVETSGC